MLNGKNFDPGSITYKIYVLYQISITYILWQPIIDFKHPYINYLEHLLP